MLSTLDNASDICPYLGKSTAEDLDSIQAQATTWPFMTQMDLVNGEGAIDFPYFAQSLVNPVFKVENEDVTQMGMFDQHFAAQLQ